MSEPFPNPAFDINQLIQVIRNPWTYAEMWLAPLGGAYFLLSAFFLVSAAYLHWHVKTPTGVAVSVLIFGALSALMFPEMRIIGYLSILAGFLYILWKLARKSA